MTATLMARILKMNLTAVQDQVTAACLRSGRAPSSVELIAVTKYAAWPWIESLSQLHHVFGENRPQQLADRHHQLPAVQWHLIGQLQRNKAKLALQHASVIHSVDSLRLLTRLADISEELRIRPRLLLQVNTTGEPSKSGFTPEELQLAWELVLPYAGKVQLDGLMTIAQESADPESARPAFAALSHLRDKLAAHPLAVEQGIPLTQLSMGMSGDFEVAIEEGATMIRIGSRLFEGLEDATG